MVTTGVGVGGRGVISLLLLLFRGKKLPLLWLQLQLGSHSVAWIPSCSQQQLFLPVIVSLIAACGEFHPPFFARTLHLFSLVWLMLSLPLLSLVCLSVFPQPYPLFRSCPSLPFSWEDRLPSFQLSQPHLGGPFPSRGRDRFPSVPLSLFLFPLSFP